MIFLFIIFKNLKKKSFFDAIHLYSVSATSSDYPEVLSYTLVMQ